MIIWSDYPANLSVAITRTSQPIINRTPPIGVIAPKIRTCVKAKKYKEPLKKTIPKNNNQPAQFTLIDVVPLIKPITNRPKRFPSDISIETKNNSVTGIIDSIQIRSLDVKVRNYKKIDELNENIKQDVIHTIIAHSSIV